jgi:hypothetical protein
MLLGTTPVLKRTNMPTIIMSNDGTFALVTIETISPTVMTAKIIKDA